MKLEKEMHVRSKINGVIAKITDIESKEERYILDNNFNKGFCETEIDSVNSSPNIIDLIEVGDYVNGSEVYDFHRIYDKNKDMFISVGVVTIDCCLEGSRNSWILEKDIKSIVTREQFSSMEYKLGDEK